MSRLYNTFEFTGEATFPKDKDRFLTMTESKEYKTFRVNFGIKESSTNCVFVELFGNMKKDGTGVVFSYSKGTEAEKGSQLQIKWNDRLKPEIKDMVADFKKIVIDLTEDEDVKSEIHKIAYEIRSIEYKGEKSEGDITKLKELKAKYDTLAVDRHEFLAEYDAIQFLAENAEKMKDKKFKVKGSFEVTEWKGKFYRKFKVESMELVSNEAKNQLRAKIDIFFDKDSMDDTDFEQDKKVYFNAFVQSYDSKAKKDAFYPQQFVINATKIDTSNQEIMNRINFMKGFFKASNDEVAHLQWEVAVFRGAEKEDIQLEDLTDKQRELIEMGMKTLEDFNKKGMLGKNSEEIRLLCPVLEGEFDEGAVIVDMTPEELVYVTSQDESINDIKSPTKPQTKVVEEKPVEDKEELFKDLFS